MEESEFFLELKFISALALAKFMNLFCVETVSSLSVFSSHPLFSCIVTFCTLILLYLPQLFWKLVFSPVLILTGTLLLAILRFGANQRSQNEQTGISGTSEPIVNAVNRATKEDKEENENRIGPEETNSVQKVRQWITTEFKSQMGFNSNALFEEPFVESWNVKAPLEVIHEEYEGEEGDLDLNERMGIPKYTSLSRYYPESDSDSSSDAGFPSIRNWESPENVPFRWDEEDREGLIEIALDGGNKRALEFQFEEENLIEIDISPTRHNEFSGEISGN